MKTLLNIFLIASLVSSKTIVAQCLPNGGFELGNTNNWSIYSGSEHGDVNKFSAGGSTKNYQVLNKNAGNDPFSGEPVCVKGNYSLKLGKHVDGSNSSTWKQNESVDGDKEQMIGYTFTVTNTNKDLCFYWSVVLTNPDHFKSDQPFFTWYILRHQNKAPGSNDWWKDPKQDKLYKKHNKTILPNDKLCKDGPQVTDYFNGDPEKYKMKYVPWTCQKYDLSEYIGEQITIWFITSDCSAGVHSAYAYIDGLCEPDGANPSFNLPSQACANGSSPLVMDVSNTSGENKYFIEIQECDANMVPIPGSEMVNQWYNGQASSIDLRNWYVNTKKKQFKCNTYYKVKLAVSNDCDPWQESSHLLFMDCPVIDAGMDKFICCTDIPVTIGTSAIHGYTYSWVSYSGDPSTTSPSGVIGTTTPLTVLPPDNTLYVVTAKDALGCTASDQVFVVYSGNFNASPGLTMANNSTFGKCWDPNESYPIPDPCVPYLYTSNSHYKCGGRTLEGTYWSSVKNALLTYQWLGSNDNINFTPIAGATTSTYPINANYKYYKASIFNGCKTEITSSFQVNVPVDYFQKPLSVLSYSNYFGLSRPVFRIYDRIDGSGNAYLPLGVGPAYHAYRYRLQIYTLLGQELRCIEKTLPPSGYFSSGDIAWDGTTDGGGTVAAATYEFKLTLWNCTTPTNGTQNPYYSQPYCVQYNTGFWDWLIHGGSHSCKTPGQHNVQQYSGKIIFYGN